MEYSTPHFSLTNHETLRCPECQDCKVLFGVYNSLIAIHGDSGMLDMFCVKFCNFCDLRHCHLPITFSDCTVNYMFILILMLDEGYSTERLFRCRFPGIQILVNQFFGNQISLKIKFFGQHQKLEI